MIRLLCTFTLEDSLDKTVNAISSTYSILNNKIFILSFKGKEELACTYNIDSINLNTLIENTISIHRHKETNTLYTINGLNFLIKSLNNNILNKNYKIKWEDYKNSALMVTDNTLIIYQLEIFDIINL